MSLPDYYKVLEIPSTATPAQIREAYKKQALKSHPDRVPNDSPERPERTKRFQEINDAYYTLSDPTRRRDYDSARKYSRSAGTSATSDDIPGAWSSFGFGSRNEEEEERFSNEQFGDVFEEMMNDEGMGGGNTSHGRFWALLGGLAGAAIGFIVANLPGTIAGAVAGNRLGAVRDAKGKSVYSVFQELPHEDKARMLSQLAAKVFAHAVSG